MRFALALVPLLISSAIAQPVGPATGTGYPANATPFTASATGTTAAVAASMPASTTLTNYLCGFAITSQATAGATGTATVAGVTGGTMTYVQGAQAAPANSILQEDFYPCIPASAINTAITVTSAAAGAGGVTAVTLQGYLVGTR